MSKHILGLSAFYHDSAAAIVRNGEIIAAAQEERFSRKKHDPRFPRNAINYCLEEAFIEADELDAVVFYDNPLLTWDRVVKGTAQSGPESREQFEKAARSVLGVKFWLQDMVEKSLGSSRLLLVTEHHMSHAASAFYPSPFKEAAIMTLDGVGEWTTAATGVGSGQRVELHNSIEYPHSLGLLYSAFTYYCGFKVNSGEYKLMGLAPYGQPTYADRIKEHLIDIKPDGSFRLNTEYFGYVDGLYMTNDKFEQLFGGPPRQPESRIGLREMDMAASIQAVTEEIVLKMARHLRRETALPNLVMAGGVALNCVVNGRIVEEGIFDQIWIQPAAGDAGGALGAALLAAHQYFDIPRPDPQNGRDSQRGSYLGPRYQPAEVTAFLNRKSYPYYQYAHDDERVRVIAQALADEKIVGFFSGRMEFGPRALGGRSILGDPRSKDAQTIINLKIKYRESFRPFAPSVLVEDYSKYFELDCESPYMLLVAPVCESRRIFVDIRTALTSKNEDMLAVVNEPRSDIPAVTHVDYSARVQTVHAEDNPEYHRVIKAFKEITGYGVVVNTSFNVRGEPIVCTPEDAYRCFMRTEMDLLVLENCLLLKDEQPMFNDDGDWRNEYELD